MTIYDSIITRTPIDKGWSGDQKYRAITTNGTTCLLRISPISQSERRQREYLQTKQIAALGIPMCIPLEFGFCCDGVYTIQSWIDGQDAEDLIGSLPPSQQYQYGIDAGRILARIHSIPAPNDIPEWEVRYNAKIDRKIAMYNACGLKYDNDVPFFTYIAQHRHLLRGRPHSCQHGDYHIGNMMIDRSGTLIIIDFDREDYGDPWEEFNRIFWCVQASPAFASGMVDGYFEHKVPLEFWKLLALYLCQNIIGSLPWAIPFGNEEIQVMRRQAAQILEWYDGMKNAIPNWYQSV